MGIGSSNLGSHRVFRFEKLIDPGIRWSSLKGRASLCFPGSAHAYPRGKGAERGLRPAASLRLCPPVHMAIDGWMVRVRSLSFWLGSLPGGEAASLERLLANRCPSSGA